MTIISVAIFSRGGKILLSRQYIPVSSVRIQGLLAAFPKLFSTSRQHTFVETEDVRYVYQTFDKIFLVLLTTKASNLLEDLGTLTMLGKVLPLYCVFRNENNEIVSAQSACLPSVVLKNAFELSFAFDEIVSSGGFREKVSLAQVRTYMEGDSHEEKVQEMIQQNKEREAKHRMKQKAAELREKHRAMEKMKTMQMLGVGERGPDGFPLAMGGGEGRSYEGGGSSHSPYSSFGLSPEARSPREITPAQESRPAGQVGMVLKVSSRPTAQSFLEKLQTEDDNISAVSALASRNAASATAAPEAVDSVSCSVIERLSVILNKDGGMESLEVKGELSMTVNGANLKDVQVMTNGVSSSSFQVRTHPNISKTAFFSDGVIKSKDPARAFPIGQALPVLKWRFTSMEEADAPLLVNCWPAPISDGKMEVNIEYELIRVEMELVDLTIYIPLPGKADPAIGFFSSGDLKYNRLDRLIEWTNPFVNEGKASGTLDFVLETANQTAFFPVSARFVTKNTYNRVEVSSVMDGDRATSFGFSSKLMTDQYVIT